MRRRSGRGFDNQVHVVCLADGRQVVLRRWRRPREPELPRAAFLRGHGVPVMTKIGESEEIRFTRAEIEALAGRVDLLTHNHGDDSASTVDDLNFAVAVDVSEINAFGATSR
jgi:NAD(P)-dependent dehydrogenase (short-subunit alcohol dehydrogenase family)